MKESKFGTAKGQQPKTEAKQMGARRRVRPVDRSQQGAALAEAGKKPAEKKIAEPQNFVDTSHSAVVESLQVTAITPTDSQQQETMMTFTLKNLSKNGKTAFYSGGATVLRFALSAFPDKQAPASFEVPDGIFAPVKVKMTPEERKALKATQPKLTVAERIARDEERLAARKAKFAAAMAAADQTL